MKKIALILTAISLPAIADVTLYGELQNGISTTSAKIKGSKGEQKSNYTTLNDHLPRIGFKGSENLGGDTKVIWQLEQRIALFKTETNWGTRDSFIGLEGNFGKIRAGRLSNQFNEMVEVDKFMYARGSALGLSNYNREGKRVVSARYDTPVYKGFRANIQYVPRDNANPSDKYTHQEAAHDELIAGLNYRGEKGFAKLGYSLKKNNYRDANGQYKDGQIVRLDAGYQSNGFEIGGGVQYGHGNETAQGYSRWLLDGISYDGQTVWTDNNKSEAVKAKEAVLEAAYDTGNWQHKIAYAHGWAAKGINTNEVLVDKYNQVVAGSDYRFSKRTILRGQVGYLKVGDKTKLSGTSTGSLEFAAAQIGLQHKF